MHDPEFVYAALQALGRSLPETGEVEAFGHPNWKVAGKTFLAFETYRGRPSVGVKATLAEQATLVARPGFSVSPYVGKHGWTSIDLLADVDVDEILGLARRSFALVAPKRVLVAMKVSASAPGEATKPPKRARAPGRATARGKTRSGRAAAAERARALRSGTTRRVGRSRPTTRGRRRDPS